MLPGRNARAPPAETRAVEESDALQGGMVHQATIGTSSFRHEDELHKDSDR